jgi:uncharacterized membrane protein
MIPLGKTTLYYFVEQLLPGYSKKSMTRRATDGHQKNSTESLILAQDERWRRA